VTELARRAPAAIFSPVPRSIRSMIDWRIVDYARTMARLQEAISWPRKPEPLRDDEIDIPNGLITNLAELVQQDQSTGTAISRSGRRSANALVRELNKLGEELTWTIPLRTSVRIGIGGSLAAPPLQHHRAYGSVPRRFDRVRRLAMPPTEEGQLSRSKR
jgi:hypothetical protein